MTFRITRRAGVVAATCMATVLALAAPAFAHTEIQLDPAQAGAAGAVMKVKSEAESDTAGIASVQIFMPQGMDPKVTLVSGPDGWKAQVGPDNVTVSGPALAKKVDAEFSLKLGQLPTTESVLTFKTLVTYSDGKVDRWIGAPGSDNPAPTVSLAPAAAVETTAPIKPSNAENIAPASSVAEPASSSNTTAWWLVGAIVVAMVAAGAVWVARRRRNTP
jgi:uncharacterized protein YcnI